MKRIAALLALCLLSGTFLRAQGDAYAFFTSSYRATVGFMDLEDPSSFSTVPGALDQTSFVLAAEEAEGRVYAYTGLSFFNMVMPGAFSAVSLGEDAYYDEILAVYNTMDYLYYDMAYDRQAGRMYAIAGLRTDNLHWGSYLLEVNISEGDSCGNFRVLGRFAEDLCALDADEDGHVYASVHDFPEHGLQSQRWIPLLEHGGTGRGSCLVPCGRAFRGGFLGGRLSGRV